MGISVTQWHWRYWRWSTHGRILPWVDHLQCQLILVFFVRWRFNQSLFQGFFNQILPGVAPDGVLHRHRSGAAPGGALLLVERRRTLAPWKGRVESAAKMAGRPRALESFCKWCGVERCFSGLFLLIYMCVFSIFVHHSWKWVTHIFRVGLTQPSQIWFTRAPTVNLHICWQSHHGFPVDSTLNQANQKHHLWAQNSSYKWI